MVRRNKKIKHGWKTALLITSIAVLNLFGISYAFWEDELSVFMKINTANLEMSLDGYNSANKFSDTNDDGNSDDSYIITYDDDNSILKIDAYVYENMQEIVTETESEIKYSAEYSEFEGAIPFKLANKGNVPVEYTYKSIEADDGLNLSLSNIPESLDPMESTENPYIHIKAAEGTYNFVIELQYSNKY